MEIRSKNDGIEITGYVNSAERLSKPLTTRTGQTFRERICAGAFSKAIERNHNVRALLNHNWERDLGGTNDGTLELVEDNIGLKAKLFTRDADVVTKGHNGDLVGWSFGFTDRDVDQKDEDGMLTRNVKDLDLYEVSLLDRQKTPAYDGTLVSIRADEIHYHGEPMLDNIEVREQAQQQNADNIDYTKVDAIIEEMKGETNV